MMWKSWIGIMIASIQIAFWPIVTNAITPVTPVSSAATTDTNGMIDKTYTFSEVNGLEGFTLRGSNATREFYLPILREWDFSSVTLHLILYRAAFLARSTTLTLYASNRPIDSIELSGLGINKTWDVTLPASLVKNGLISLLFSSVVNEVGFSCYNLINPSYWIYVSGDSTVTYHYKNSNYSPDLAKLPYPFIHDPSLTQDTVLIVLPDKPSLKILSASFNVANMLGNKATWRGIKINNTSTSQIATNPNKDSNIIMIGTGKELGLNTISNNWSLPIDQDGTILDKNKQKIADNVGVILLSSSPYNPKDALLAVTGNSEEAVNNAALMLRDPDFANTVLYSSQALVLTKPNIVPMKPHWQDITLKMLGFNNQTVYGSAGDTLIDYDIELPQDKKIKKLTLSVNYVVSNFLKNQGAPYLTIRVNGTPVGGTELTVKDETIKTWDFDIDGSNFLPGKNRITFDFNIRLKNQDCNPQVTSLAWVTLFSSTQLHVDLENKDNFLSFPQFTSSNKDLAIAIPTSQAFFQDVNFIQKLLEFAKLMQQMGYVDFYDVNALNNQNMQDKDILYVGDINNNALKPYLKSIPFYFANNNLHVSKDLLSELSISNETPAAITELLTSFFNPNNLMLFIMGRDSAGYLSGIDALTNTKKVGLINGNVVLTYENNTFNSVQSQKLKIQADNKKKIKNAAVVFYYFIGAVILFIIGIVLAIVIRRKWKYYFSKNHDNE